MIESGSGDERVVFLHGVGGTHRYWTCGQQPLLFPHKRTVLADLLGFGDSPRPWCRYTVDRHLAALHRGLTGEGGMTLVGHSMGAVLALAYAARHPEAVRRLFLIALPHFGSQRAAYAWFWRKPGGWLYTNMAATALTCLVTRRVAGRWLPALLPDLPRVIAEDLVKHNFMSSTTSIWEVLYRHDAAVDMRVLKSDMPVYFVHGMRDTSAPFGGVLQLVASRPNGRVELLAGVDHHPWLRQPERCRQALQGFLES